MPIMSMNFLYYQNIFNIYFIQKIYKYIITQGILMVLKNLIDNDF
jgi:hypothetical protein